MLTPAHTDRILVGVDEHRMMFIGADSTTNLDNPSLRPLREASHLTAAALMFQKITPMSHIPTGDMLNMIVEYFGFCPTLYLIRETCKGFKS
jgi:hypothetical protein